MSSPGASEGAIIAVGDPRRRDVPPEVMTAHGGFAWWYTDAVDADGNGAVLIWSWGLPFLPGYLSGAREGRGVPARARPSLNVSFYRGGKPDFYLLQTYHEDEAEMDRQGNLRFGRNRIRRLDDGHVRVELDCDLPQTRARLMGTVDVRGVPARLAEGLNPSPDPSHRWTPVLGPCRMVVDARVGREHYELDAPAYHDRNEGTRRFDDLGIDHWIWGRLAEPERTTIWYLTYGKSGPPVAWGAELLADGSVHLVPGIQPIIETPRRGPFGLRTWDRVRLLDARGEDWLRVEVGARVDDGPFYARTLVEASRKDATGPGLGEWIVPDRIDLGRHRPLVRMAVHRTEASNSVWLPLFSGPRAGRVARLLRLGSRGSGLPEEAS